MIEYIPYVLAAFGFAWSLGFLVTAYKLQSYPGFPVDYTGLLVGWPLTLVGLVAAERFTDGFNPAEIASDVEGTEWKSAEELLDDE